MGFDLSNLGAPATVGFEELIVGGKAIAAEAGFLIEHGGQEDLRVHLHLALFVDLITGGGGCPLLNDHQSSPYQRDRQEYHKDREGPGLQ
ncbi:MAG: hypothetical protein ACR2MY_13745 [Candidatus Dormibacteria bacterium]